MTRVPVHYTRLYLNMRGHPWSKEKRAEHIGLDLTKYGNVISGRDKTVDKDVEDRAEIEYENYMQDVAKNFDLLSIPQPEEKESSVTKLNPALVEILFTTGKEVALARETFSEGSAIKSESIGKLWDICGMDDVYGGGNKFAMMLGTNKAKDPKVRCGERGISMCPEVFAEVILRVNEVLNEMDAGMVVEEVEQDEFVTDIKVEVEDWTKARYKLEMSLDEFDVNYEVDRGEGFHIYRVSFEGLDSHALQNVTSFLPHFGTVKFQ